MANVLRCHTYVETWHLLYLRYNLYNKDTEIKTIQNTIISHNISQEQTHPPTHNLYILTGQSTLTDHSYIHKEAMSTNTLTNYITTSDVEQYQRQWIGQ